MRHLSLLFLLFLLFALPSFASMPTPAVPLPEHSICQRKHCDCAAFELAQVPELGPSSLACVCGHSPAVHGDQAHSDALAASISPAAFTQHPKEPHIMSTVPSSATTPNGEKPTEPILQYFKFAHLPPHLQAASKPFCDVADHVMTLPRSPERSVALRKLLEAKDAAVRAALST